MKRGNSFLVSISALVLLLQVSGGINPILVNAQEQPKYGGKLTWGFSGEPAHLNPVLTVESNTQMACSSIFSSLVTWTTNYELKGDLAKSWETSSDGLTITFHLYEDVYWHDGVKFTSEDVRYTFEELIPEHHPERATTKSLNSVETPDANTVVFHLASPDQGLIKSLYGRVGFIMPKHIYDGTDIKTNPHNSNPIGTGPFKFAEWKAGEYIRLVRNDNYFKKDDQGNRLPFLDEVIIRFVKTGDVMIMMVEKGELDYWYRVEQLNQIEMLETLSGWVVTPVVYLTGTPWGIAINMKRPIVGGYTDRDIMVRHAIDLAIDKQFILQTVWYNTYDPIYGHIPDTRGASAWANNPAIKSYPRNVTEANRLLDEAGYPKGQDGIRFTLEMPQWNLEAAAKFSEIIVQNLKDVGIDVKLTLLDKVTWQEKAHVRFEYDLTNLNWATAPDPSALAVCFHSSQIGAGPWSNIMQYNNSRVDELLDNSKKETDTDKRKAMFQEVEQILFDDMPSIPLGLAIHTCVEKEEFMNLPTTVSQRDRGIETVWWTKGNVPSSALIPFEYQVAIVAVVAIAVIAAVSVIILRRRKK